MRRLVITVGVLVSVASSVLPAWAAKRVALVIGNDNYRNVPKLQKAVNDARAMGETLKKLGFELMVAENQTRQGFSQALLSFETKLDKGDTAFFFYAGHGFEITGQNYLLPTDIPAATAGQEELVRDSAVLADRIVERLQNKGIRSAILVFDACRNNPFERSGVRALSGGGGLAPMGQLPEGVFSIFSAGPRQTALDRLSNNDTDPNSVFTRIFIKELQEPSLNLVQIAQRTRRTVSELAETVKHHQVPVYFDQMVDDVFLNGQGPSQGPSPAQSGADPVQAGTIPTSQLPKVAALSPANTLPLPAPDNPNAPIASFSRHNGGWTVVFSIADPALGISWRKGESGDFRETGFMDTFDPRTRRRMPNPSIQLDADEPATTLQVRYIDANGEMQGPFPIRFDPETALIRDQRKILDMTASNWLAFGGSNGLLYYTHLLSYRCAIREVRLGFDTSVPDQALKLPPCNMHDPIAVPDNASTYMKVPGSVRSVSVELRFRDGSVSEIRTFRR